MRPALKKFYGRRWRTVIRPAILARAGYECERCALPDRPMGRHSTLEIAHLDGRPCPDPDLEQLACLCHRCHRRHDYDVWATQFRVWLERRRIERAEAKDAERPLLQLLKEAL